MNKFSRFAFKCGVQSALQQRVMGKVIYFCSDSQAAIEALASANSRSKLVIVCQTQIEELNSVNSVNLVWVPGHSSIAGNELSDELARDGASHDFIGPEPAIRISSWAKLQINSWAATLLLLSGITSQLGQSLLLRLVFL